MDTPTIYVHGPVENRSEVRQQIITSFSGARVLFAAEEQSDVDSNRQIDVLIYYTDPGVNVAEDFRCLLQLVADHPTPSIVVVGKTGEIIKDLAPGAVLCSSHSSRDVAEAAKKSYFGSWWFAISRIDQPIMVVDRRERVTRANSAAFQRFGPDLIGQTYRNAVEHAGQSGLPATHPIRRVLEQSSEPRALCQYHEFPRPSPQANRANLVCVPIVGSDGFVEAVVVLYFDMDRWARIFESAKRLGQVDSRLELCDAILDEVRNLGYRRARIYKVSDDKLRLKGIASLGFEESRDAEFLQIHGVNRAEYFRTRFEIEIGKDAPSTDTLLTRCFPALCVCSQPEASDSTSDLERHYSHDRLFSFELDCDHVSRWIDVPLLIPTSGDCEGIQKWGKLSVDNGEDSERLEARDVADLAMFAAIASGHLAAVERSQEQLTQLDVFRRYATKLVKGLQSNAAGEASTLEVVLDLLLKMYGELTGADVTYYRDHQGAIPYDKLMLNERLVHWSEQGNVGDYDIPIEIRRQDGFSARLLEKVNESGSWLGNPEPIAVPPDPTLTESGTPSHWTGPERSFMLEHDRALLIPVVVAGRFKGAIFALNRHGRDFKAEAATVQRFMDTAALWFELGELQDQQLWLASTMERLLRGFGPLTAAPDHPEDFSFFAILATMLTSHLGMGWNRAWIFRRSASRTMELSYAIGGLGDGEHRSVQEQLEKSWKEIVPLLEIRGNSPEPVRDDGELDPLYKYCVHIPKVDGQPIRIHFDENVPRSNPLVNILSHDYRTVPDFEIPLRCHIQKEWFHGPKEFPHAMQPTGKLYAFPFWCTYGEEEEPLGLVLFDMLYHPQHRLEAMMAATRLILSLTASVLTARRQQQRTIGMFKQLSVAEHGITIKEEWDGFIGRIGQLLSVLCDADISPRNVEHAEQTARWILDFAPEFDDQRFSELIKLAFGQVQVLLETMAGRMSRWLVAQTSSESQIADLAEFVDQKLDPYKQKGVRIEWLEGGRPEEAIDVFCTPLVLEDAISCLVDNARWAAKAADRSPEVYLSLRCKTVAQLSPFAKFVELSIIDNGDGVPDEIRDHIFHDGFTSWASVDQAESRNRGKGLGLVRNQLRASRGDLQLRSPLSVDGDHAAGKGPVGAHFVISIGVMRGMAPSSVNSDPLAYSGAANVS